MTIDVYVAACMKICEVNKDGKFLLMIGKAITSLAMIACAL